jgi:hypothetical protein
VVVDYDTQPFCELKLKRQKVHGSKILEPIENQEGQKMDYGGRTRYSSMRPFSRAPYESNY